ncbi:Pentatricopeptide repeat-containing protein [Vitis vinifera]|uniref:Pentatricopeptide repeat-containing protein n=1 Tax=Vitis vinifera TaxID=29760 RepID=A0A438IIG6_VITVI|nr:Pentatricopeptide repeat-containing protein [Vitis vinifera]
MVFLKRGLNSIKICGMRVLFQKFGLMAHAQVAFEDLPTRDVVLWNAIVNGFAMKIWCDSSIDVSNSLIKMYGKCKCIEDALEIFEMMQGKDIFSCNSVVSIHEECGDHDGTLRLLDRMLGAKIQPDLVTVTTVLLACSHLVVLMHGREIHGYMIVSGLGKDGKCIDDVLPKMHLMHSHCLQNPLVYVMPLGIQRCFLKLEINIKLTFKTLPCC